MNKTQNGVSLPPKYIDFILTNECNLRCDYCPRYASKTEITDGIMWMETGKMLGIVEQLVPFRPSIRLFGGEPFLHPDWDLLVRYAHSRGIWCTGVTNGTLLLEQAERIIESGIVAVGISLDGTSHTLSARDREGFQIAHDGIDELIRRKKKLQRKYPLIEVYTTIYEENVHLLVDFAHFLSQRDISLLNLQHLIWTTEEQIEETLRILHTLIGEATIFGNDRGYVRNRPPRIDGITLRDQIQRLKEGTFPFRIEFHPDLPLDELEHYHSNVQCKRTVFKPCMATERLTFIDPLGRLFPCITVEMGNVFERPFLECWNSNRFRAFRRYRQTKGPLPICHRCPG